MISTVNQGHGKFALLSKLLVQRTDNFFIKKDYYYIVMYREEHVIWINFVNILQCCIVQLNEVLHFLNFLFVCFVFLVNFCLFVLRHTVEWSRMILIGWLKSYDTISCFLFAGWNLRVVHITNIVVYTVLGGHPPSQGNLFIYFHQTNSIQTQYSKIHQNNIKMMEEVQRKSKSL